MSTKTLSSSVKIRTSELPPEIGRRYGLFGNDVSLDFPLIGLKQQDQRLKNDITSAMYRLELDNGKPSYHLHKHSPGAALLLQTDHHRRPSRRHSYIEPRLIREVPLGPIRVKEVRYNEPENHISPSTLWYYTEPRSHSILRSTPNTRFASEIGGNRALADYRDTLTAPVTRSHQRWSIHGSTPRLFDSRSSSTPPDLYRTSQVRVPVGDRLTRRQNHEFSIGQKLAESHTDLDAFDRLLDKKFGRRANLWDNTSSSIYPWWPYTTYRSPTYYDYKLPANDYGYTGYNPPSRVTNFSETSLPYSYLDYVPYGGGGSSSSRYTRYVPTRYVPTTYNYVVHSPTTYRYEPWYTPYSRRSYYAGYPHWSLGLGATSYLL